MRTAVVWTLLALLPFASLQMICVDHGSGDGVREVGSSPVPDCTEFCLRAEAPPAPAAAEGGCVLLAGDCSLLAAMLIALPERGPALAAPVETADATASLPRSRYLTPALQHLTPPPKA